MKNTLYRIVVLFLFTIGVHGQEEKLGVLESDTTWLKEIIKFPINFASDISYEGYEDLRFSKHWSKKDSSDFWTYAFTWHIKGVQKVNETILESHMKSYYNGLMEAVNKKKDFKVPQTMVLFLKDTGNNQIDYIGKIRVYDSFHTERIIVLNIQMTQFYCEQTDTSDLLFRISPQPFDHDIWQSLRTVTLRSDYCAD
ncbi:hypothetical protein SAMN04515667_1950 [Formosa sp. Hel1_31_208]|uniref:hypothetical protein n=1 Tax=Formosa sp. Hel1_31_208 TaxID=1798225 RepID=UPI00087D9C1A|nr:hypothetical protein [Formosa sp. Hel1_31_208]SDS33869.1 hypothetical protein SAMN04515667_1950 [Formosa sp. Hel1_31_208]